MLTTGGFLFGLACTGIALALLAALRLISVAVTRQRRAGKAPRAPREPARLRERL